MEFCNSVPFLQLLGIKTVDLGPATSTLQVEYRLDLTQPAGIMHGGVVATLIDTGIAHAILMTDAFREVSQEGASMVTVDLRVKYFRPISQGMITCVSTLPRVGRQLIHAESVVTNHEGKEVARGDSTYMIVRRQHFTR